MCIRDRLTTFLADDDFDANMDSGSYGDIVIPEGSRNATPVSYTHLDVYKRQKHGQTHFRLIRAFSVQ